MSAEDIASNSAAKADNAPLEEQISNDDSAILRQPLNIRIPPKATSKFSLLFFVDRLTI
jgi:hypothetical protein